MIVEVTFKPITHHYEVVVEQGREGLFYGTSPQLPGFLIAGKSEAELIKDAPRAVHNWWAVKNNAVSTVVVTAPKHWQIVNHPKDGRFSALQWGSDGRYWGEPWGTVEKFSYAMAAKKAEELRKNKVVG